jgi:zinc/manganese transport system substrate-binding protein
MEAIRPRRSVLVGSSTRRARFLSTAVFATAYLGLVSPASLRAEELRVCATTPDVGALVREVGGDRVSVTVFVKGTEDPHFAEAKPSFVKQLNQSDLYVQAGFELEMGYAPVLLQQARNPRIIPGAPGFLDLSPAVGRPLDVPGTAVDRSMGDVHPYGNPHYFLDPLRGLAAAQIIERKLVELDPAARSYFEGRLKGFEQRLYQDLVGAALAEKYAEDVSKLAFLFQTGRLGSFLEERGQRALLGGWLGKMMPHFGAKAVDDHPIWPYFAHTFGLTIVAHLEPLPGVPPTTKHLEGVISLMKAQDVKLVLASAYYDPRYATLVADSTGATVLRMANQVEAVPEADTYLHMISYNVDQVARALGGAG